MRECPICFSNLKERFTIITTCGHKFCLNCIVDMYDTSCPFCREDFRDVLPEKILNIILKK